MQMPLRFHYRIQLPRTLLITSCILITASISGLEANPTGEQLIHGQATFSRSGNQLTIGQTSNSAIIHWDAFSIAANEHTRFALPGSTASTLNRVTGSQASNLQGLLESNANLYLINPQGILIGASARIETGGFIASTLDISDDDYLNGGTMRFSGDSQATISIEGSIHANEGDLLLIAREIQQGGQLSAPQGTVALAAASEVLVSAPDSAGQRVFIKAGEGHISQSGLIEAARAELRSAGGNPYALAINQSGIVRATGTRTNNGAIWLVAETGESRVSGELQARLGDKGGDIRVLGETVWIDPTAKLLATGNTDGGSILIGGDYQGGNPAIANAYNTFIASGAYADASALNTGDGGRIIVWADHALDFRGELKARGGANGGNGGFIETSGGFLTITGLADASAPKGTAGEWLIDPYNITIVTNGTGNSNQAGNPNFASNGNNATLEVGTVETALNLSTNVTISTGGGGGQIGNIVWNAAMNYNGAAATLTLNAHNDIQLSAAITSATNTLALTFNADSDANGGGSIILGANLSSNGGDITFQDGVYISNPGAGITINSNGGNVLFQNQLIIANPNGLTIDSTTGGGGGNITFSGLVDSGNSYSRVAGPLTWSAALAAAKSGTGANTGDTYLATITSAFENSIAATTANYNAAWLGGSRPLSDGNWRWVAGPEGLEDSGNGRLFFVQNAAGSGGAASGGAYTNWNGGEPNNFNSGASQPLANGRFESSLQFVGTQGRWNDLPENSSTLPYIVETNIAASPLTLRAGNGGGTITFNASIGSNKPLASLNLDTATAVNANTAVIAMEGTLTVSNNTPINITHATGTTITANDLSLGSSITGAGKTLALQPYTTSRDISIGAGANTGLAINTAELGRFTDGFSTLTFGRSDGTGTATVTNTNITDNLRVLAGNIALNGSLNNAGNTVTLQAGTAITGNGSGVVTATGLKLQAGGAVSLSAASQAVTTLAASANSLDFADNTGYDIGTVDGTSGLTTSGNARLSSTAAVTQSQAISTGSLELVGAGGNWTLTHAANTVGTLAANTATLSLINNAALTIGTAGATNGISLTGNLSVQTTGAASDITLNQGISTDTGNAAAATTATTVLATSRNFINTAGSSPIATGSGKYLVYTTSLANDTPGGFVPPQRQFGVTYAGSPPASFAAETTSKFLHSVIPTLTIRADDKSRSYGIANPALTYSVIGLLGGDATATALSGSPLLSTGATLSSAIGTYPINILQNTLASPFGYLLTFVDGTFTVSSAPVIISPPTSTIDGTTGTKIVYSAGGSVNTFTVPSPVQTTILIEIDETIERATTVNGTRAESSPEMVQTEPYDAPLTVRTESYTLERFDVFFRQKPGRFLEKADDGHDFLGNILAESSFRDFLLAE